ncbi:MAG: EAL domain-containing protein [Lachnospiraceae bacterium]|nr:EAL domain-containing protein [Lachnospiraceae bacterium]
MCILGVLQLISGLFITDETKFVAVGDVFSLILCVMLISLFTITYVSKGRIFHMFQAMIGLLMIASWSDLIWHSLIVSDMANDTLIYIFHFVYRMALLSILSIFCFYTVELMYLEEKPRKASYIYINVGIVLFVFAEILTVLTKTGFQRIDSNLFTEGYSIFRLAYFYFLGYCIYLLIRYRKRMVTKIAISIVAVFLLCFLIYLLQTIHDQNSYTVITLTLPIIAVMYLLHSNPYETSTGAVSESSFNQRVSEAYKDNKELVLMCLRIQGFEGLNSFTPSMRLEIFKYFRNIKKGVLFRVGGRLVMVFPKELNPDYKNTISDLCKTFDTLFLKYSHDFKAMFLVSEDFLNKDNLYSALFDFMESRVSYNTYYWITKKDIEDFRMQQYVLSELEDISLKKDLDDKRVIPYCQPVYNVMTKSYDTAEALMRLNLDKKGMIYPDYFISLAEEHNYIHDLSLIILNKTCQMINKFIKDGKKLERISVNFSMQEVRDDNFAKDIIEVIDRNNVPYHMIAVELTESQNDEDFELVKSRIEELKQYGIKFYLDDFGTGYSNFDRIMELPFDIIKFDRSLVVESAKDKSSAYMVDTFAGMFKNLKYRVLYEGIEDISDENRCINMHAEFLQGYKYSRPINMSELERFLSA